jgi:hypothetical protein
LFWTPNYGSLRARSEGVGFSRAVLVRGTSASADPNRNCAIPISHSHAVKEGNRRDLYHSAWEHGQQKVHWKVTPNAAYGEPRALAYKLDKLVIDRRIDEVGRPVPELIRIGSLREIAKELDLGGNTNEVKKALRQNAHTVITAKLTFTDRQGHQQYVEFEATRHGVVFAGEILPNGLRADAVYLTLNAAYRGC